MAVHTLFNMEVKKHIAQFEKKTEIVKTKFKNA